MVRYIKDDKKIARHCDVPVAYVESVRRATPLTPAPVSSKLTESDGAKSTWDKNNGEGSVWRARRAAKQGCDKLLEAMLAARV